MNYFENLSGWLNMPIKESALEVATLRLDELIDVNSDGLKASKNFSDDYINYWLHKIYLKIRSMKSIAAQADSIENVGNEVCLKNLVRLNK